MKRTCSISPSRLRRIARLLQVLANSDFGVNPARSVGEAKAAIQGAISSLGAFSKYFGDVVRMEKKESEQSYRKFFNFFTMADTAFNTSMADYQQTIGELSRECQSILKSAENSGSLAEMREKISNGNSKFHALVETFEEIEPKLKEIAASGNRQFAYGAIGNAQSFVSSLSQVLGFDNVEAMKRALATKHFNDQFNTRKASRFRRVRSRSRVAAILRN